jgi:CRP/FNR family transcriptional regulator, cyclic AMP receptor protein
VGRELGERDELQPVAFTDNIATKGEGMITFDPHIFLGDVRTTADYRANEVVYSQGDSADSVFFIQSGTTKITVFSERGKEAIVGLPRAGEFFGEGCLAGQELRQATVSARTKCVIVRLAKARIIRMIRDEPAFAELFISHLVARNIRVEEDLVDHLFNSSERRLARVLLSLANLDKEDRQETIPVKMSQEMLAEMIGTTRSRVNLFMNKFRKLGFIDYKDHIEVHNSLFNVISERQIGSSNDTEQHKRSALTGPFTDKRGGAHMRRRREVQAASTRAQS